MRFRRSSLAGAAFLLTFGALAAADSSDALVGRWQLNDKESEDPQAKFRPLRPGEDPTRPDSDEQRPGERRQRPARQRPGEPPPKLEAPPGLVEFLEPPRTLVISGSDNELTLDDGKGAQLKLPVDGVERKEGALATSARWEGQSLIVEKKNEQGARLTTRYSLMPGQKKLEVYQRLAGKEGRAVTLRRVYDGAQAQS